MKREWDILTVRNRRICWSQYFAARGYILILILFNQSLLNLTKQLFCPKTMSNLGLCGRLCVECVWVAERQAVGAEVQFTELRAEQGHAHNPSQRFAGPCVCVCSKVCVCVCVCVLHSGNAEMILSFNGLDGFVCSPACVCDCLPTYHCLNF